MLLIFKHPVGPAKGLCWSQVHREFTEQPILGNRSGYHAACRWGPVICHSGNCWGCFPLSLACVIVSLCTLSLARASLSIFPLVLLVSGTLGAPGDHLSCFQATKILTAGLPVKFKMYL